MDLSRAGDLLRAFLADVEAAAYRGCHVGQRWAFRRSELTEWVRLTEGTRWIHSRT